MIIVAIFKSVRGLIQWSVRILRDLWALGSTLAALGMLQPQAVKSLKTRKDLGLSLYHLELAKLYFD